MPKNILVISGSPVQNGNTSMLIEWFCQGARTHDARVEIIRAADIKYKVTGCISCRACQKITRYKCVIDDEAAPVLEKMTIVDVIVMASPLYFFSVSAQLKLLLDRMFSLYKWDNTTGAMETALRGKMLVLIASAYEQAGLHELEAPFKMIAVYSGMDFESLLVGGAGVSGDVKNVAGIAEKAIALGQKVS